MHIQEDTLDDLLRRVFGRLLKSRNRPSPTKGANREEIGALLTLRKPRARVSRTEQRATLFTCLGETLWYLSGSDRLDAIEYYIPNYRSFSDLPPEAVTAGGAYGPRLFGTGSGIDQVRRVIDMLGRADKHDTRQAIIQIFDKNDIGNLDVPCTCTLQFFARGKLLHCHAAMRSNDAYLGLPHDIFAFTFLQELIARSIGHELGAYHHTVGSLHLYDEKEAAARTYIEEGWQSSVEVVSPMPLGDPWPSLRWLQEQERAIRGGRLSIDAVTGVDPYWMDLARLLLIKAYFDRKDMRNLVRESRALASAGYTNFIRGKQRALQVKAGELPLLQGQKTETAS